MQTSSGLPTRTPTPFANSGAKNTIPVASQISVTPGAASYTDGFPPLTRTPIAAGGVPPFGVDFNGILNAITTAVRWSNAGGQYPYDSTFSTAVGGYPKGAILARSGFDGFWVSTAENNTTNPDAAGAGWNMLSAQGWDYVVGAGSANIYTAAYVPAILALKDGLTLHSTAIAANTGASTFSPNGLTAKPILSLAQVALAGGELVVNGRFSVRYSLTLDSWILISASGGNSMSGRLINIQIISASGTYTPDPRMQTVVIEAVGGGGGTALVPSTTSAQTASTGGAQSGAYAKGQFTKAQVGTSQSVTIGQGGTGGVASGSVASTDGGVTTVGSLISCPGGARSLAGSVIASGTVDMSTPGSVSQAIVGGNILAIPGQMGTFGVTSTSSQLGGSGGSNPLGTGGSGVGNSSSTPNAGKGYGSGAGACCNTVSSSAKNGAAGASGVAIFWEFA